MAALASATQAQADVLPFTGSVTAIGITSPNPACSPRFRGNIDPASSSGTSSLGAFTYRHTVCTGRNQPIDGTFTIDFGGDGFFGNLAGTTAANPTIPNIFDLTIAYTVLGGTGRFLGATGTFGTGPGSNTDTNFQPSRITLNFTNGLINAPAVPEPGTWAMLIVGFGMVGWSMRYRSARKAFA